MQIEKERFEAWLFSQPRERDYCYINIHDCVICKFLKETTSLEHPTASPNHFRPKGYSDIPILYPKWLAEVEPKLLASNKTFGQVQDAYIELVGNPLPITTVERNEVLA